MALIGDFLKALGQIGDRRFTGLLIRSLALTVGLLVALAALAAWVMGFLPESVALPWIGEIPLPSALFQGLAFGSVLWLSSFLMFPVAAMFVSLSLESITDAVEERHYPADRGTRSISLIESVGSAVRFALVVIGVNLVALIPYLLAGPLAPLVFLAVNGYLLGREYFQLVAERHLPPREAENFRRRYGFRVWLAGTLMSVPLTVPIFNLVIPVLGVATFTHQFHRLRASAGTAARDS